jgi:DNA-binding transcriptional MocR family regulator
MRWEATGPPSSGEVEISRPSVAAAKSKKAHELVADLLRQRIVSGELAEGERLPPEEELTEQFGIACTTLREALRVLESQGLISTAARRRTCRDPPSLDPVAMALAVSLNCRRPPSPTSTLPDDRAPGRGARAPTTPTTSTLESAIEEAPTPPNGTTNWIGVAAANVHATLVERSGNRTLATLSALLQNMVVDYYMSSMPRSTRR